MLFSYFASWILNLVMISVIVGVVDKYMHNEIEKHQTLGAFLIFIVPTLLETFSYFYFNEPFLEFLL